METQKKFFITKRTNKMEDGTIISQWWAYVINNHTIGYIPLSCSNLKCPIEAFEDKLANDLEKHFGCSIGEFKPSYVLF